MNARYVTLPGRIVPLGTYVRAWRQVIAADPEAVFAQGLDGGGSRTAREIRRQFCDGMHDRINSRVPCALRGTPEAPKPVSPVGRKWSPDWQRAARRCAREVNTPRLIVRYVPADLHGRLAHRIYEEEL